MGQMTGNLHVECRVFWLSGELAESKSQTTDVFGHNLVLTLEEDDTIARDLKERNIDDGKNEKGLK